jgi:hypothetical protein
MDMEQLFKKLPRDLQWEILSVFVGTHVVRNGKLRRKLTYSTSQDGTLLRQVGDELLPVINGLRVRQHYDWNYDRDDNIRWHVRWVDHPPIKFYEDNISGDTIYGYKVLIDTFPLWELHHPNYKVENSVFLPPFVKHDFPSYPHTNKKRRLPLPR